MESPDTVSEAVEYLTALGYDQTLELSGAGLRPTSDACGTHAIETAVVDHTFRFEGPSDPGDEAIVLGVTCQACGTKGIVVSAYGPGADPEHARLLASLSAPPKS